MSTHEYAAHHVQQHHSRRAPPMLASSPHTPHRRALMPPRRWNLVIRKQLQSGTKQQVVSLESHE